MAEQPIEVEGKIVSVLAGTMFRVALDNKHEVLAHISGRMRQRFIRLTTGDRGEARKCRRTTWNTQARIVFRLK